MEFVDTNFIITLTVAILTGAAAGLLGTFMVMKRMSLVGDALSHVALPGLAIAILLNINPFLGAFAFLAAAIWGVWLLQEKTSLPIDAIVGIFFTASLAVGVVLFPDEELLEALFGDISTITLGDGILSLVFLIGILLVIKYISKGLLLGIVSKDLARSANSRQPQIELVFLGLVALIVALGIKVVGALLMGALVILPAATGKNLSRSFAGFVNISILAGSLSGALGIFLTKFYDISPGPAIIIVAVALFLVSLIFKRK